MVISAAAVSSSAQKKDDPQTRSIFSDDFDNKRPAARSSSATRPRRVYQFVKTEKSPLPRKSTPKVDATKGSKAPGGPTTKGKAPEEPNMKAALTMSEVGVTVWRLRPPKKGEEGEFLSVAVDEKTRAKWLAERVDPDHDTFTRADKLRFGVESSKPGYLYIIDREACEDGSFGPPFLLFPESLRDDNSVGPGILVDVPPQQQADPYFNITPECRDYAGELMTIIISPNPLNDFKVDSKGKIIDNDVLGEIEFGSEASIYTRADAEDRLFSKTEAEAAACGTKDRQLVRQKSQPCDVGTRQLTRVAPLPQTIYQVKAPADKPGTLFMRLVIH